MDAATCSCETTSDTRTAWSFQEAIRNFASRPESVLDTQLTFLGPLTPEVKSVTLIINDGARTGPGEQRHAEIRRRGYPYTPLKSELPDSSL
jgi:hypothetical protein